MTKDRASVALCIHEDRASGLLDLLPEVPDSFKVSELAELHITLAYLGDIEDIPATEDEVRSVVAEFAKACEPIEGVLNGFGVFQHTQSENGDAFYLNYDSPQLPAVRQALVQALEEAGVRVSVDHGFTPHVTLAYLPPDESIPSIKVPGDRLDFSSVALCWGDSMSHFLLTPKPIRNLDWFALTPEDYVMRRPTQRLSSVNDALPPDFGDPDLKTLLLEVKTYAKELPYPLDPARVIKGVRRDFPGIPESTLCRVMNVALWTAWTEGNLLGGEPPPVKMNSEEEPFLYYSHTPKAVEVMAWGGPVKALGGGKVGGQLVLYGTVAQKDLTEEYFTAQTYYGPRNGDGADVMIHHGIPIKKGMEAYADILLPPMATKTNNLGIWAETILRLADDFEKKVYELAQKGAWKWSSGTADHMIRKKANGEIVRWPIIEGSLTPTPAEPRMLNHAIHPLKTLIGVEWERFGARSGRTGRSVLALNAARRRRLRR